MRLIMNNCNSLPKKRPYFFFVDYKKEKKLHSHFFNCNSLPKKWPYFFSVDYKKEKKLHSHFFKTKLAGVFVSLLVEIVLCHDNCNYLLKKQPYFFFVDYKKEKKLHSYFFKTLSQRAFFVFLLMEIVGVRTNCIANFCVRGGVCPCGFTPGPHARREIQVLNA